jgi:hypothetical protein
MLNNLQALLQNPQLQAKIKAAADKAAILELLLIASVEKGYGFTMESINDLLAELNPVSSELSEDELLNVSGALGAAASCSYCSWHSRCF